MNKYKKLRLLELAGVRHRSDLITEGDDLFGGGEEEGGDEGGDDLFGGGEEEGGEEEGEGEEGGEEEGEEEPEEEPEEPAEKLSNEEIAAHGPGEIDTELDGVMQNIFSKSLNTAKVKSQVSVGYPGAKDEIEIEESLKKYSMKALLLEGEEAPEEEEKLPTAETVNSENFDLDYFTGEVARYIKNYDVLMDMEGMIFNKAKQFILSQFGEELANDFEQKIKLVYDISMEPEELEFPAPVATGATAAGGGGV